MIIVDVETTGLDPLKHSIISIGAVDFEKGDEFYVECCAIPGREIDDAALAINGFTREMCLDTSKKSAVEAYKEFFWWTTDNRSVMLAGQQVGSFDAKFLQHMHQLAGLGNWPFGHRTLDLHSVAYAKYRKSLNLDGILAEVGLEPEPKPHNALTGAKLEYLAFKILLS
jgi:DNA polymerase III epsilon subunit-like protein